MLSLTPWQDRLRHASVALRQVAGAVDLAAAQTNLVNAPAGFVLPGRQTAGPNRLMAGAVEQELAVVVSVVLAVRNVADGRGRDSVEQLAEIREAVLARLLGWQPADAGMPVELAGGQPLGLPDQTLWWQDDYRTTAVVRKV